MINEMYGGSFMKAIMECYTEREWLPWKFQIVPRYNLDQVLKRQKLLG